MRARPARMTNSRRGGAAGAPRAPGAARASAFARLGFLAVLASLGACATPPPASDPQALADYRATNDPLEPTNRFFYRVSLTVDRYTLKPVAEAYVDVVPRPVRTGVHNILVNAAEPVTFLNGVLEGKPRRAGDSFVRFALNTTVGLAGAFDVADALGYKQNDSSGRLTLAYYGLPSGPYLFLPVVGPSSPRDATGQYGLDTALKPLTFVPRGYGLLTLNDALTGLGVVDARALVLHDLDQLEKTALDPYASIRSAYRQQGDSQLKALRADDRSTPPDWYAR